MAIIEYKKPRQKQWGILQNNILVKLNYGGNFDGNGSPITSYSSNCFDDMLEEAKKIIASGCGVANINVVELVPYDFLMTPTV